VAQLAFTQVYKFADDVVLPLLSIEARDVYRFLLRHRWNDTKDAQRHGTVALTLSEMEHGKVNEGIRATFGTGLKRTRLATALEELEASGLVARVGSSTGKGTRAKWFVKTIDAEFDYEAFVTDLEQHFLSKGVVPRGIIVAKKEFESLLVMNGEVPKLLKRHAAYNSENTDYAAYTSYFTFLANRGIAVTDGKTKNKKAKTAKTGSPSGVGIALLQDLELKDLELKNLKDKSFKNLKEQASTLLVDSSKASLEPSVNSPKNKHAAFGEKSAAKKLSSAQLQRLESFSYGSLYPVIDELKVPDSVKTQLKATTHAASGAKADIGQLNRIVNATPFYFEGAVIDALDAMVRNATFTMPYFLACIRRSKFTPENAQRPVEARQLIEGNTSSGEALKGVQRGAWVELDASLRALSVHEFLRVGRFTRSEWPSGKIVNGFDREGVWAAMWNVMLEQEDKWMQYAKQQGGLGNNAFQEIDIAWPYNHLFAGEVEKWADEQMDWAIQGFERNFGDALASTWRR